MWFCVASSPYLASHSHTILPFFLPPLQIQRWTRWSARLVPLSVYVLFPSNTSASPSLCVCLFVWINCNDIYILCCMCLLFAFLSIGLALLLIQCSTRWRVTQSTVVASYQAHVLHLFLAILFSFVFFFVAVVNYSFQCEPIR
uniref:Uncharacterized protein n=1 Tax=Anopheles darlingi TaxID=43151 RepID=A0A2M4DS56_ANODA